MVLMEELKLVAWAEPSSRPHALPRISACPRASAAPPPPHRYLQLQDVPRTADHAPSRTFYTWRANSDVAIARVASDLYRAAGNLHARLVHEIRRQQELLDELSQSGDRAPTVAERRKAEVAALKAVTSRLEAALLDLDAQICLFADV